MELSLDVATMLRERPALQVWLTTSTNDDVGSFDDVARLAGEFLGAFGRYDVRMATNSEDMPQASGVSWTPATDHTFDAGIAVIGQSGCGLYWVADEV